VYAAILLLAGRVAFVKYEIYLIYFARNITVTNITVKTPFLGLKQLKWMFLPTCNNYN
jgi:hypothetical protein